MTEFKERNAGILTNRWVDTSHGAKGDKIYGMFDPSTDPEIVKENLQEWLCDHRMEVTECISIALRNHERTYCEWFQYVDSCLSPDELALYCLSRKHGIHTLVLNKSYIWTTFSNHLVRSDDEIIELCGVNLVFLGPACYDILRKIRRPVLQSSSNNTTSTSTSTITPTMRRQKTTCHEGGATGRKKRERSLMQGRGKHPSVLTLTSRKRPQTLSESHSQTYGITAPVTRSLRSGLKPIDYVSLNDGFEDESIKPSKKKKRESYRPRGAPSATRVAARNNTVSPEAKEPANKPDVKKSNTLSGVPLHNIPVADTALNLTGIPDPMNPDTLPDLINSRLGDTENTEGEIDAIDALLSLGDTRENNNNNNNNNKYIYSFVMLQCSPNSFFLIILTLGFCPKEKVTGHETSSVPLGDCPDLRLT